MSEIETHDMRSDDAPPPPRLAALFGRRIRRAWVLPLKAAPMLVLRLSGGWLIMMEAMRTDMPGAVSAVNIEVGQEIDGARWGDLDLACSQTPHLRALRGMRITGFRGGTLEIDKEYGVQVRPDGIRWIKLKGAKE